MVSLQESQRLPSTSARLWLWFYSSLSGTVKQYRFLRRPMLRFHSLFHLVSVSCDLKRTMSKRRPSLTTPTRRHRCITPTRDTRVLQPMSESHQSSTMTNDFGDLFAITQPEDALMKQRADEPPRRLSNMSRSESLPLYNLVDPAGTVPPYETCPSK